MNYTTKKYLVLALFFLLGFALAVALGHVLPKAVSVAPMESTPEKPSQTVDAAGLERFLDAARRGDYQTMANDGGEVFWKGVHIPDSKNLFKDYEANSFPPYTVYAFYSQGSNEKVRRVLLTMDEKERVESFLAEEMTVLQ